MEKKTNTIGNRLKKARNKKNLTLDEIYEKLKIHPRILLALEEDRGEEELSSVYIKAFLKNYSHYLGIEGDALIKELLAHRPTDERSSAEYPKNPPEPEEPKLKPRSFSINIDFKKITPPLVATVSIVVVLYVIFFAGSRLVSGVRKMTQNRASAAASRQEVARETSSPASAKPIGGFQVIPENVDLVLELKALQELWLEVKSDGKIVFRRTLPKGSVETWEAGKSIELWLGKAEAAELVLNGQALKSPGRGVMKGIKLTRKGMKTTK